MPKTHQVTCSCGCKVSMPAPDPKNRIPATNEIRQYIHCGTCFKTRPPNISMRDWANYEVGFTPAGLQVWCIRHNINIVHIDFQGRKHPANCDITEEAPHDQG